MQQVSIKNIIKGYSEYIAKKGEYNETTKKRLTICSECPEAKEQWLPQIIDGIIGKDPYSGIGCNICKCPINKKVLVEEEKCPINKW